MFRQRLCWRIGCFRVGEKKQVEITGQKYKCEKQQVTSVKDPKDIAGNDKRGKRKAKQEVTEIEKEEFDIATAFYRRCYTRTNE